MKYEVIECKMGAFQFGPDSHLLWLRDFWYPTNDFRETKSIYVLSSWYGYRRLVHPKWLPLNICLSKIVINNTGQCYRIRNQEDGGILTNAASYFPRNSSQKCIYNGGTLSESNQSQQLEDKYLTLS